MSLLGHVIVWCLLCGDVRPWSLVHSVKKTPQRSDISRNSHVDLKEDWETKGKILYANEIIPTTTLSPEVTAAQFDEINEEFGEGSTSSFPLIPLNVTEKLEASSCCETALTTELIEVTTELNSEAVGKNVVKGFGKEASQKSPRISFHPVGAAGKNVTLKKTKNKNGVQFKLLGKTKPQSKQKSKVNINLDKVVVTTARSLKRHVRNVNQSNENDHTTDKFESNAMNRLYSALMTDINDPSKKKRENDGALDKSNNFMADGFWETPMTRIMGAGVDDVKVQFARPLVSNLNSLNDSGCFEMAAKDEPLPIMSNEDNGRNIPLFGGTVGLSDLTQSPTKHQVDDLVSKIVNSTTKSDEQHRNVYSSEHSKKSRQKWGELAGKLQPIWDIAGEGKSQLTTESPLSQQNQILSFDDEVPSQPSPDTNYGSDTQNKPEIINSNKPNKSNEMNSSNLNIDVDHLQSKGKSSEWKSVNTKAHKTWKGSNSGKELLDNYQNANTESTNEELEERILGDGRAKFHFITQKPTKTNYYESFETDELVNPSQKFSYSRVDFPKSYKNHYKWSNPQPQLRQILNLRNTMARQKPHALQGTAMNDESLDSPDSRNLTNDSLSKWDYSNLMNMPVKESQQALEPFNVPNYYENSIKWKADTNFQHPSYEEYNIRGRPPTMDGPLVSELFPNRELTHSKIPELIDQNDEESFRQEQRLRYQPKWELPRPNDFCDLKSKWRQPSYSNSPPATLFNSNWVQLNASSALGPSSNWERRLGDRRLQNSEDRGQKINADMLGFSNTIDEGLALRQSVDLPIPKEMNLPQGSMVMPDTKWDTANLQSSFNEDSVSNKGSNQNENFSKEMITNQQPMFDDNIPAKYETSDRETDSANTQNCKQNKYFGTNLLATNSYKYGEIKPNEFDINNPLVKYHQSIQVPDMNPAPFKSRQCSLQMEEHPMNQNGQCLDELFDINAKSKHLKEPEKHSTRNGSIEWQRLSSQDKSYSNSHINNVFGSSKNFVEKYYETVPEWGDSSQKLKNGYVEPISTNSLGSKLQINQGNMQLINEAAADNVYNDISHFQKRNNATNKEIINIREPQQDASISRSTSIDEACPWRHHEDNTLVMKKASQQVSKSAIQSYQPTVNSVLDENMDHSNEGAILQASKQLESGGFTSHSERGWKSQYSQNPSLRDIQRQWDTANYVSNPITAESQLHWEPNSLEGELEPQEKVPNLQGLEGCPATENNDSSVTFTDQVTVQKNNQKSSISDAVKSSKLHARMTGNKCMKSFTSNSQKSKLNSDTAALKNGKIGETRDTGAAPLQTNIQNPTFDEITPSLKVKNQLQNPATVLPETESVKIVDGNKPINYKLESSLVEDKQNGLDTASFVENSIDSDQKEKGNVKEIRSSDSQYRSKSKKPKLTTSINVDVDEISVSEPQTTDGNDQEDHSERLDMSREAQRRFNKWMMIESRARSYHQSQPKKSVRMNKPVRFKVASKTKRRKVVPPINITIAMKNLFNRVSPSDVTVRNSSSLCPDGSFKFSIELKDKLAQFHKRSVLNQTNNKLTIK